ncbi:ArsR/SmtB family transcription factor [Streptomyces sp. URMC 123]|uniref:ArsR/SmtB family transcription factor n=1 Tax=Streptomyces sp. URMC 123 TaxID=3423403 RepID=UPI003F1DE717
MIRIRLTAEDVAAVRFAPRPAPLQELNAALTMLCGRDDALLFGRWRRRVLRSLPGAAAPLAELAPGAVAPAFIDVFDDSLQEGLDTVRAAPPELVRSEVERVYARHPAPAPLWVRELHRGDAEAWRTLRRAQLAAFETVLRPVWPLVQDLHRAEFTRHALAVAEGGIGAALAGLVPGARLSGGVWEIESPVDRDIEPGGEGVVLVPTFHWTGRLLVARPPGLPLHVTYAAGPGLPLSPTASADATDPTDPAEALAAVLGRTRLDILLLLAEEHTTGGLARRLGVSNATVSAHTAALRGAGLISTVRAGRSVLHHRTPLGTLLVHHRALPRRAALRGAGP